MASWGLIVIEQRLGEQVSSFGGQWPERILAARLTNKHLIKVDIKSPPHNLLTLLFHHPQLNVLNIAVFGENETTNNTSSYEL